MPAGVALPRVLSSSVMAFSLPHCHGSSLVRLPQLFLKSKQCHGLVFPSDHRVEGVWHLMPPVPHDGNRC